METKNDKGSMNIKSHGELTAKIGKSLKLERHDVIYDHGVPGVNVGKIVSTIAEDYGRDDVLSQLDIAIVEKGSDNVVVLVEIEETTDKPKTIIGDALGTLMGNYIYLPERRKGRVGEWTTLIILGKGNSRNKKRISYILEKVEKAKSALNTNNSAIGNLIIDTFADGEELDALLPSVLDKAFKGEL